MALYFANPKLTFKGDRSEDGGSKLPRKVGQYLSQTTGRNIPEDSHLHTRPREELKSQSSLNAFNLWISFRERAMTNEYPKTAVRHGVSQTLSGYFYSKTHVNIKEVIYQSNLTHYCENRQSFLCDQDTECGRESIRKLQRH
jgi:hypothetical protein